MCSPGHRSEKEAVQFVGLSFISELSIIFLKSSRELFHGFLFLKIQSHSRKSCSYGHIDFLIWRQKWGSNLGLCWVGEDVGNSFLIKTALGFILQFPHVRNTSFVDRSLREKGKKKFFLVFGCATQHVASYFSDQD